MHSISRPASWAMREISYRHHPHSAICLLTIALLGRLNLPLIYLASEATLIYRIACSLWQKVAKTRVESKTHSNHFDRMTLITICRTAQIIGSIALRRIELIFEIARQFLFGPEKLGEPLSNTRSMTPHQPPIPQGRRIEKIKFLPKENHQRAMQILGEINNMAREKQLDSAPFCGVKNRREKGACDTRGKKLDQTHQKAGAIGDLIDQTAQYPTERAPSQRSQGLFFLKSAPAMTLGTKIPHTLARRSKFKSSKKAR